ncbi:MAG TPA: LysM peptidoglycan-binding domain-containing protein [Actinomycetota bacterium]|jgi:Tfp pilus assembly protein FimV|nr:LysM peptidoglycan-binding domain-containing protein [Actinomycetota bacterium]
MALGLAVTIAAAAWAAPIARALGPDGGPEVASAGSYVVREGDTLWSIALRLAPGEDPRPMVDAIVASNGVVPESLVPGQALLVPSAG